MEAVKKLPMISFELKNSPEPTSFHNLKQVTRFEDFNLICIISLFLIMVTHLVFFCLFTLTVHRRILSRGSRLVCEGVSRAGTTSRPCMSAQGGL